MARKIKNTAILAKLETVNGTAVTPAATDAVLISDATITVEYANVDRNLIRPYFGNSGMLPGTRNVKIEFTCELFASGVLGTAPAWGPLLIACAFAEVVTATTRVDYTPVTTGLKSLTINYHMDGVTHVASGCMGNVVMNTKEGERPTFKFSFTGIDGGPTAVASPTVDYTAWKTPLVVNSANSNKVTFGGTYSAGAVTGGTQYCSRGFEIDMANDVKFLPLLGCQSVDITDRKPKSAIELELTAAQEVTMRSEINASTQSSVSLLHGTTAGAKVLVFAANCMRTNPAYSDFNGSALLKMDLSLLPVAGNDELRIVCI